MENLVFLDSDSFWIHTDCSHYERTPRSVRSYSVRRSEVLSGGSRNCLLEPGCSQTFAPSTTTSRALTSHTHLH